MNLSVFAAQTAFLIVGPIVCAVDESLRVRAKMGTVSRILGAGLDDDEERAIGDDANQAVGQGHLSTDEGKED